MKIAFIKYAGMASGGVEKYLQTLAVHLPNEIEVDFYYTDDTPLIGNSFVHPSTDQGRIDYMLSNNINLIKIECAARDDRAGKHSEWVGTNFFEVFDGEKYDLVQTGRGGYKEYPFYNMEDSLFVDSVHSQGNEGVEVRNNILKTVLISKTQADQWVTNGGDSKKIEIIPTLVEVPERKDSDLKSSLGIEGKFVFGMHQGNREDIFSPAPLSAYSKIEADDTCFVILGGAKQYKAQAKELGLKNCYFLEFNSDVEYINNFVEGIDVFAHGRKDGEVCSAAIIEALYHGKPCVSHPAINNGHLEQLEGCGIICNSIESYSSSMEELKSNEDYYQFLSRKSTEKWQSTYNLEQCVKKYVDIYSSVT